MEKHEKFSFRKFKGIGLASATIGATLLGLSITNQAQASTVNSTTDTSATSETVTKTDDTQNVDAAKDKAVQNIDVENNAQQNSATQAANNAQASSASQAAETPKAVIATSDGQTAVGATNSQDRQPEQTQAIQKAQEALKTQTAESGTSSTSETDANATKVTQEADDANKTSETISTKDLQATGDVKNLEENKVTSTKSAQEGVDPVKYASNGGYDPSIWGTMNVNDWTLSGDEITGYTGNDTTHIIIPNSVDFAKAGKIKNGHIATITSYTMSDLVHNKDQTKAPQTIAISKTNNAKIKAKDNNWPWVFNSSEDRNFSYSQKTNLNRIELSGLNVDNVTNFHGMFGGNNISDISSLSNWSTSQVTDMGGMFSGNPISNLNPIRNWDVSNVTNFSSMFNGFHAPSLEALSNWNVSNGTNFNSMFSTSYLKDISAINHWNVSKGTNFGQMFGNGDSSLDFVSLPNWTNSNLKDISNLTGRVYEHMIINNSVLAENNTHSYTNELHFSNGDKITIPTYINVDSADKASVTAYIRSLVDQAIQTEQTKLGSGHTITIDPSVDQSDPVALANASLLVDSTAQVTIDATYQAPTNYVFNPATTGTTSLSELVEELGDASDWKMGTTQGGVVTSLTSPTDLTASDISITQNGQTANFYHAGTYTVSLKQSGIDKFAKANDGYKFTFEPVTITIKPLQIGFSGMGTSNAVPYNADGNYYFGSSDYLQPEILNGRLDSDGAINIISSSSSLSTNDFKLADDAQANAKFKVKSFGTDGLINPRVGQYYTIADVQRQELYDTLFVPDDEYNKTVMKKYLTINNPNIKDTDVDFTGIIEGQIMVNIVPDVQIKYVDPSGTTVSTQEIGVNQYGSREQLTPSDLKVPTGYSLSTNNPLIQDDYFDQSSIVENPEDSTQAASDKIKQQYLTVNVTPNTYNITVNYVDKTDPSKGTVSTWKQSLAYGTTFNPLDHVPTNYAVQSGYTTGTQTVSGTATINVPVVHKTQDVSATDKNAKASATYRVIERRPSQYGGNKTIDTRTVSVTRSAVKDLVTGEVTYGKFNVSGSSDWMDNLSVDQIAGYTFSAPTWNSTEKTSGNHHVISFYKNGDNKVTLDVYGGENFDSLPASRDFYVDYTPNAQTLTINYVDNDNNNTKVTTKTVSGVTDGTVNVPQDIPANYVLSGTIPATYTLKASGNTLTVNLKHKTQDVTKSDPNTKATAEYRVIEDLPDGTQKVLADMQVTAYKTATKDLITGDVTYGDYSTKNVTVVNGAIDSASDVQYKYGSTPDASYAIGHATTVAGYTPVISSGGINSQDNKIYVSFGTPESNDKYALDFANGTSTSIVANPYNFSNLPASHDFHITYTPNAQSATLNYVDTTNNKTIKSVPLTGKTDQTISTGAAVPDGYQLKSGTSLPTSYKFTADSNQTITVNLVHKIKTVTSAHPYSQGDTLDTGVTAPSGLTKSDLDSPAVRTIHFILPSGKTINLSLDTNNNLVQTIDFTRNAQVDEVTKSVTYTDWLTSDGKKSGEAMFPSVTIPKIAGYKAVLEPATQAQTLNLAQSLSIAPSKLGQLLMVSFRAVQPSLNNNTQDAPSSNKTPETPSGNQMSNVTPSTNDTPSTSDAPSATPVTSDTPSSTKTPDTPSAAPATNDTPVASDPVVVPSAPAYVTDIAPSNKMAQDNQPAGNTATVTRTTTYNLPNGKTETTKQSVKFTKDKQGVYRTKNGDTTAMLPEVAIKQISGYKPQVSGDVSAIRVDANSDLDNLNPVISYVEISQTRQAITQGAKSVQDTQKANQLPQTGAQDTQAAIALGISSVLSSLGLVEISKRKKKHE